MTIGELLDALATELDGPTVPPARATARDLIAALVDKPRFWPSAHRDDLLGDATVARAREAARQIRSGMPFAYAVQRSSFRHLTLRVDRRVLIPRQETEELVGHALAMTGGRGAIADIGTGSGAIALSLAAEGAFDRVIATDVSEDALNVARANLDAIPEARRAAIEFRCGDLLAPLAGERLGAVVSNPPYIAPEEESDLPEAVRSWEPRRALISEAGGMAATYGILAAAPDVLESGGMLVVETDSRRAGLARERAATDGRYVDVELRRDLSGRDRFLVARRT